MATNAKREAAASILIVSWKSLNDLLVDSAFHERAQRRKTKQSLSWLVVDIDIAANPVNPVRFRTMIWIAFPQLKKSFKLR